MSEHDARGARLEQAEAHRLHRPALQPAPLGDLELDLVQVDHDAVGRDQSEDAVSRRPGEGDRDLGRPVGGCDAQLGRDRLAAPPAGSASTSATTAITSSGPTRRMTGMSP